MSNCGEDLASLAHAGSPGGQTGDFSGLSEAEAVKERKQCQLQ